MSSPTDMQTAPWLSVLIPTYNGERFLEECLAGIVAQNFHDLEVIAVDDGSTDGTINILDSFSNKIPLRVLTGAKVRNWVASTNIGLQAARGQFISILHQDDIWSPRRLIQLQALHKKYPDATLYLHPSRFIDSTGKELGLWKCPFPSELQLLSSEFLLPRLIVQNFIAIPAPLFRRDAAFKVGGLDEELWFTADWKLWLQLAAIGNWRYSTEPLADFRIHRQSLTVSGSADQAAFRRQHQLVLDEFLPLAAPSARTKKVALFSAECNATLAAMFSNRTLPSRDFFWRALTLGPRGWLDYLQYSRIVERSMPRLHLARATS